MLQKKSSPSIDTIDDIKRLRELMVSGEIHVPKEFYVAESKSYEVDRNKNTAFLPGIVWPIGSHDNG